MKRFLIVFFSLIELVVKPMPHAESVKNPHVQAFIQMMVKQHGFKANELIKDLEQAVYQPAIIESMNKPYEKKPWNQYKSLFITPERINGGLAFWEANQALLEKAEATYHVPVTVIVAILGIETRYGKNQGNYRVLDALTTLAFHYPKRADFFTKELKEYLILCQEHHVSPTFYQGSYAGAIGMPQFMPSSYRFYAVNFTHQPKKDLVHDNAAAIASVANYLSKHGWNIREDVAQPAQIKGNGYRSINTTYKHAQYQEKDLHRVGILPMMPSHHTPHAKAGLIALSNEDGFEYWLTYPNFYVITRYNTSPQYAMAVHLLAQTLKQQWALRQNAKQYA